MSFSPLQKYIARKVKWYVVTLFVAISLIFILPQLTPSDPIETVLAKNKVRMTEEQYSIVEKYYAQKFELDKPIYMQYIKFLFKTITMDLGESFVHEKMVWSILTEALPWTLALQLLSIIFGYLLGNILGVAAAYKRGVYDKVLYPMSLFLMSIPYFCLGIIFVYFLGIKSRVFPAMGAYAFDLLPSVSFRFVGSVIYHYTLPFITITLVLMGGQAISMRSLAIYELGSGYVKYSKMLGAKDSQIVKYVFKNAMLPQLTNLALALGFAIGGSLLIEIVFSYPGLGSVLYAAVKESDYPVIQAGALLVTIIVLTMNFVVDIVAGFLDPRIKANLEERSI